MYIRTTRFQVKKGSIAKFQELSDYARAKASKLEGLLQNYLAIDSSGKGVMVGVWESKEKAEANLEAIKANWAGVMEHMEGQPQMDEYPTVAQVKG
jgi:quinol monooxygenase YgiN